MALLLDKEEHHIATSVLDREFGRVSTQIKFTILLLLTTRTANLWEESSLPEFVRDKLAELPSQQCGKSKIAPSAQILLNFFIQSKLLT